MRQTIFNFVTLLVVAAFMAGCSGIPALIPIQASPTAAQAATQAAAQAAEPTGTATISTPAVVTVGASPTVVPSATATHVPSKTPKPTAAPKYAPVIKASNFVKTINNPYFPLTPGTTFLFNGTKDNSKVLNQVVVTKKTRKIMGVTCVEVDDTVMVDDKLEEKTIDWYAQDKQGNVWYFGEDSKEYNTSGKVISTEGSWLAGVKGALPGIVMQAKPEVDLSYRQEYLKGHAEDMAQILSLTESIQVPTGSYDNVLLTKDWTPLETKIVENKWYAKGVGLVRSLMVQGGEEDMQLTEIKK